MKKDTLLAFAVDTPYMGCRNQLLGALDAINKNSKTALPAEKCLLLPSGAETVDDMRESLCYAHFGSYRSFQNEIFALLDARLPQLPAVPRVFITAYNLTESGAADKNADMLCRAVKEYYRRHNLGKIFTVVLISRLHNYKYVDLVNVPKHLLTFYSRIRLLQNKKLRQKTLITVGTVHKFTMAGVLARKAELDEKLKKTPREPVLKQQIAKLRNFTRKSKKVVVCLGGRVEGSEIVFNVNYAKSLFEKCVALVRHGYGVVIVNGPRTPNDVTDYLYEAALSAPDIIFQNCKNIAGSDAERKVWRIYSGRHEDEFAKLKKLGNIYPAVLGYGNTLAVHTSDTYSCCETVSAGIPTAISSEGIFIDKSVRADCLNMLQLMTPKYALRFEDFVSLACYMGIEPQHLHPAVLSDLPRVFAEAVRHRITETGRRRIK